MPELHYLIGLPASGKSTYARERESASCVWISSDRIRASMEAGTSQQEVFAEVGRQAVLALQEGKDVLYDATNLSAKHRIAFLHSIAHIPCRKTAVVFLCGIGECRRRNAGRTGTARVPEDVYERYVRVFQPPAMREGWDAIELIPNGEPDPFDLEALDGFDQDNPYHTLPLGEHMRKAASYVEAHAPENGAVLEAARYHDIGKKITKVYVTHSGRPTEHAHFYGHECAGAYLYLVDAAARGKLDTPEGRERALYIADLISLHMRPLTVWEQSERARSRDEQKLGAALYADLCLLHEADVAAH